MSDTETTLSRHYRLEVRQGIHGWRWHARGPQGIEATAHGVHATREDALAEGRAALKEAGMEQWDEWMDGVTDNHFDPRAERKLVVDVAAEARRAGLAEVDVEAQKEATQKLRELEARRQAATDAAKERVVQQPADVGMGEGDEAAKGVQSPIKAQKAKAAKVQSADAE